MARTITGYAFNEQGAPIVADVRCYEADTNTLAGQTTSDAATGKYEFTDLSETTQYDIRIDYLTQVRWVKGNSQLPHSLRDANVATNAAIAPTKIACPSVPDTGDPAALSYTNLFVLEQGFAAQLKRLGGGAAWYSPVKNTLVGLESAVKDANNNTVLAFSATGSAVNTITLANAAAGNPPTISATGSDTHIGLRLVPKGNGQVQVVSANPPQWHNGASAKDLVTTGNTSSGHGPAWQNFAPATLVQGGAPTKSDVIARYCIIGKVCHVIFKCSISAAGAVVVGQPIQLQLPVAAATGYTGYVGAGSFGYYDASAALLYAGAVEIQNTTTAAFWVSGNGNRFGVTPGVTMAAGDELYGSFSYALD